MKYCQHCGTKLIDEARFCSSCGKEVVVASANDTVVGVSSDETSNRRLLNKLSARLKINAVIWIVISCFQILLSFSGAWFLLVIGILNLISAIDDLSKSNKILKNPNGIVKRYRPLAGCIFVLIYNFFIGGFIGVFGSIYYLLFVRGLVMENEEQFLSMEKKEDFSSNEKESLPSEKQEKNDCKAPQKEIEIAQVILSAKEAQTGATKDVYLEDVNKTIRFRVPKDTMNGQIFYLSKVKYIDENGKKQKKDIPIRIIVEEKE